MKDLAYLNAHFQSGFANPIDAAIVGAGDVDLANARRLDELLYDFSCRRLSVLVEQDGSAQIVTKGALDSILSVCTRAELPIGEVVELGQVKAKVTRWFESLSSRGYRVLGVATREALGDRRLSPADATLLIQRHRPMPGRSSPTERALPARDRLASSSAAR